MDRKSMLGGWRAGVVAAAALLALSACAMDTPPPPNLDLSLEHPSANKLYSVALKAPPESLVVNKMTSYEVTVRTPDGKPVDNAKIGVDGGMPQHGHGFPTQPRVTQALGDGRYLIEGLKYSMTGWWEIKLDIRASAGNDQVTFNTVVPVAGKAGR